MLALLLILALVAAVYYVTRPQRLAGIIARAVERNSPVDASIASARLSWDGSINLKGVSLRIPDQPTKADRLFDADDVHIEPNLWALWQGELAVKKIVLTHPTFYLTEEETSGRFTFQEIGNERVNPQPTRLPRRLPEVFVRNGRLQFGEIIYGRYQLRGITQLEGTVTQSNQNPGLYAFVLRAKNQTEQQPSPVLRGTFDLRQFKVEADLQNFAIGQPQRNMLPRKLRQWWDRLSPNGVFPRVEVTYGADADTGLQAKIVLKHGGLTLPYGDFAPRLSHVSGTFAIDHDTITVSDLTGRVEGVDYFIHGTIHGFDPDAAFEFQVRTKPFTIEKNPSFVKLLPQSIRKNYLRFKPSGLFQVRARIRRADPGGPFHYQGELHVLDASGRYWKFPYPLKKAHGLISFSDERVVIKDLRALGPSGATLDINGGITPPGRGAAVQMTILANDVPIDHFLLEAMNPENRKVMDMFLNQPAYDRLVKAGLVQPTPTQPVQAAYPMPASKSLPPRFNLGGRISAVIKVDRAYGDDKKYKVTTAIDTTGASMLLKAWPYPLRSEGGTLVIAPGKVLIQNVQARGLTGASGTINGKVDLGTPRRLTNRTLIPGGQQKPAAPPNPSQTPQDHENKPADFTPDIDLTNVHLPVDSLLVASIPSPQDQWIDKLHLKGVIVGNCHVFQREDDGQIDFALHGRLDHGHAALIGPTDPMKDLTGTFTISRSRLVMDELTGRHGKQQLMVSGIVDWSTGTPRTTLKVSGRDLPIGGDLLDLLGPTHPAHKQLDALMAAYHPTGRFDVELDYHGLDPTQKPTFTLTLGPKQLTFDLHEKRITLNKMTGTVEVSADKLTLDQLAFSFDGGHAKLDGQVALEDQASTAVRIQAQAKAVNDVTRTLLPTGVTQAMDAVALRGAWQAAGTLSRKTLSQAAEQTTFHATVTLRDATADVGAAVRDLTGRIEVRVSKRSDQPWPQVDLHLEADHVQVAKRWIAPLTLRLHSAGHQPNVLELTDLKGTIYGGTLVGDGLVQMDKPGRYQLHLTLNGAALVPMLDPLGDTASASAKEHAGKPNASASASHDSPRNAHDREAKVERHPADAADATHASDQSGKTSASLAIEGQRGRPGTRRGRGMFKVRDAKLYDRPLAMAVLQAASLSLPAYRSFDQASARYTIDGPTLHFNDLRFESPSLVIAGTGDMNWPTGRLDLTMVTRNPTAPDFGALNEAINVFKDEVLAIHVTGKLANPTTRLVPFAGIRDSWNQVFGPPRK